MPVGDFVIPVAPQADPTPALGDLSLGSQPKWEHSQSLDSPAGQVSDADDEAEPARALKSPKREDTWMAMVQQGAVAGLLANKQESGEDRRNIDERVAGRTVESVEQVMRLASAGMGLGPKKLLLWRAFSYLALYHYDTKTFQCSAI